MKTALRVILAAWLISGLYAAPRVNRTITITAGTPVQIATVTTQCNRIFIQMLAGGAGIGYVMDMSAYNPGKVPDSSVSGNLTAQLAPATNTAPGGWYTDMALPGQGTAPIDVSRIWVDGSNSGDTVVVSCDIRN